MDAGCGPCPHFPDVMQALVGFSPALIGMDAPMALSRDIIATVKERADIVQVIGERVHLSQSGADYLGLCPFHGEKTPSFRVSPAYRTYHCFGCGAGGSVVDFVMASEGLSFSDAVAALADRFGVTLPGGSGGAAAPVQRPLEALAAAETWFGELLNRDPRGEAARSYLRGRNFEETDWRAFNLGFALDDWQAFLHHAQGLGFSLEELLATGLVRNSQNGRPFDMLRKRVVFPIRNDRGKPIAFGGRVIDPMDNPKYLNTPETKLYRKSRVLFGLSQGLTALRGAKRAVLVEGYLDVMRMHQHGFQEALATCGTALTAEHLQVLERHAQQVILLFDGDEAGIKAALRSAPLFLNSSLEAQVVLLPDGLDPDDFLARNGADAFREHLARAESLLEFLVFQLQARNGRTLQGREQTLAELAPVLGQIRKQASRDLTVRYLADLVGVRPETVLATVERPRAPREPAPAPKPPAPASGAEEDQPLPQPVVQTLSGGLPGLTRESRPQRRLLRLLLEHRHLAPRVRGQVQATDFTDPALRRLLETLLGFTDEEFAQVGMEDLMDWFPEHGATLRAVLTDEALHMENIDEPERELDKALYRLKDERRQELFNKLKQMTGSQELEPALADYSRLSKQLRAMKEALRTTHAPRPELVLRKEGT